MKGATRKTTGDERVRIGMPMHATSQSREIRGDMLVRLITKFMLWMAGYEYREPLPSIVEPRSRWPRVKDSKHSGSERS